MIQTDIPFSSPHFSSELQLYISIILWTLNYNATEGPQIELVRGDFPPERYPTSLPPTWTPSNQGLSYIILEPTYSQPHPYLKRHQHQLILFIQ